MHDEAGMTVSKLVIGAVLGGILLSFIVIILSPHGHGPEWTNRTVCMSNLRHINEALALYKSANDGAFPWLHDKITAWDTTLVGTNRNVDPNGMHDDPNNPKPRSITSLMFLLVRMNQPAGMFRCPSDKSFRVDGAVRADANDGDALKGQYYWDFAKPENVSFSYQAPRNVDGRVYANGVVNSLTELIVYADMTPKYQGDEKWTPIPITDQTSQADIEKQLSYNHKGKQVNILRVAGNIEAQKRPDVGDSQDQIYTTYGANFKARRSATSTTLTDHKKSRDTFLIGPVGRSEAE